MTSTAMISADAKCKVYVGESAFPIASVSRGKAVIVGKNETLNVGDHDFSNVSLIPDTILMHSTPEKEKQEMSMAMTSFYDTENVPSRLYLDCDGGGDRKINNFKVKMSDLTIPSSRSGRSQCCKPSCRPLLQKSRGEMPLHRKSWSAIRWDDAKLQ